VAVHFTAASTLFPLTPQSWTIGLLDSDPWPELLSLSGGGLTVFPGLPGGTFDLAAGGTLPLAPGSVGSFFGKVRLADVDHAGAAPDILVRSTTGLTAGLNLGGGAFTTVLNPHLADLEDFPFYTGNFGGGFTDILTGFGGLSVSLGNGNGTFTPPAVYPALGENPSISAVGDISSDGFDDLVMFSIAGPPRVHFLLSQSGFTAARRSPLNLPQPARAAVIGDFDGHGFRDDLILVTLDGSLMVLLQD